jgi:hypothetical protein
VRPPPAHRATTAHLQAVYPFVAEGGLGDRGVYIGWDLFGGAFTYDAWELYAAGVLTNPRGTGRIEREVHRGHRQGNHHCRRPTQLGSHPIVSPAICNILTENRVAGSDEYMLSDRIFSCSRRSRMG